MNDPKGLVKAFAAVVVALAPLDPEGRRRVIEATHAMLPIGSGTQGGDAKKGRKPRRR